MTDPDKLVSRVDCRLRATPKGTRGRQRRAEVLRAALEVAPRTGEDFAHTILERAIPAYDVLAEAKEKAPSLHEQFALLEQAIFVAGNFRIRNLAQPLLDRVRIGLSHLDVMTLSALTT